MKTAVFWIILFVGAYVLPANLQSPFLYGMMFGMIWTYWVLKEKS